MPALPLHTAGPYVAGAYLVFLAIVLLYVGIMAAKLGRIERDLSELAELVAQRGDEVRAPAGGPLDPAELAAAGRDPA